jgi:hypothetical protein
MSDSRDAKRFWKAAVEDPRSVGRRQDRRRLRQLLGSHDVTARRRAADAVVKLAYAAPEQAAHLKEAITEASRDDDPTVRDRARRALRYVRDADPGEHRRETPATLGGSADDADVDPTVVYRPEGGPACHGDPEPVEQNAPPTSVYEGGENDDTNFCPNCGTDLRRQSVLNFCGGCGHEL